MPYCFKVMNILVIDVGSNSIRGIVYSGQAAVWEKSILTPPIFCGDKCEQSPTLVEEAIIKITAEATRRTVKERAGSFDSATIGEASNLGIDAVSVTCYRTGTLLMDEEGKPLTSIITWQDRRTDDLCKKLLPESEDLPERCGAVISSIHTLPKALWFKENCREEYEKGKIGTVESFLSSLMVGKQIVDRSCASRTMLMELHGEDWSEELCRRYEIDKDKLPKICNPGDSVGMTKESFNQRVGLKASIPVILAGGDQQCAALGAGIFDEGEMLINCGTGAFILGVRDAAIKGTEKLTCGVSALEKNFLIEEVIPTCADLINKCAKEDFLEEENPFDVMEKEASACLCNFEEEKNLQGENISRSNVTRGEKAARVFMRVASEIAEALEGFPLKSEVFKKIYVSGGLSQSDTFNKLLKREISKRFSGKNSGIDIQIIRWENVQATSIGAYAQAAAHLEESDLEKAEAVQSLVRAVRVRESYSEF